MQISSCYQELFNLENSDCVYIDYNNIALQQYTKLNLQETDTVIIYPISNNFAFKITEMDLIVCSSAIVNNEEVEQFGFTQNQTLKLVFVILPNYQQLIIQSKINDQWFSIFVKGCQIDKLQNITIQFTGTALITHREPQFLVNYPFVKVNDDQKELKQLLYKNNQSNELFYVINQLLLTLYIPDYQIQQISQKLIENTLLDIIINAQDLFSHFNINQYLDFLKYMYKSLKFKQFYFLVLKFFLLTQKQFILTEGDIRLINELEQYQLTEFNQQDTTNKFMYEFVQITLSNQFVLQQKEILKQQQQTNFNNATQQINHLLSFDVFTQQQQIYNFRMHYEPYLQLICTEKNIPLNQIMLILVIFTYSTNNCDTNISSLKGQYLKLIMNFNHKPFLKLLQKNYNLNQFELNFLVSCFDCFPEKFHVNICQIAYQNINRLNLLLQQFETFTTHFPLFKYYVKYAVVNNMQTKSYDTYLCPQIFYQQLNYRNVLIQKYVEQNILQQSKLLNSKTLIDDENQLLSYYQLEKKQDNTLRIDEMELIESETQELCFICMNLMEHKVVFNCSHKICIYCFISNLKWDSCCYCRKQIAHIEFKNQKYFL